MSWIRLALGLIREAATTQTGQDILKDIGSSAFKSRKGPGTRSAEQEETELWKQSVEERLTAADRNTEMLVRTRQAQEEVLLRVQKRQRIWNLALAAGILAAIVLSWLWHH